MSDPIEHFRLAIAAAGLTPPDYINADGAIHRYSTGDKPSHKNGFYFLHLEGIPWGQAGSWDVNGGDPVCHWCAKSAFLRHPTRRARRRCWCSRIFRPHPNRR